MFLFSPFGQGLAGSRGHWSPLLRGFLACLAAVLGFCPAAGPCRRPWAGGTVVPASWQRGPCELAAAMGNGGGVGTGGRRRSVAAAGRLAAHCAAVERGACPAVPGRSRVPECRGAGGNGVALWVVKGVLSMMVRPAPAGMGGAGKPAPGGGLYGCMGGVLLDAGDDRRGAGRCATTAMIAIQVLPTGYGSVKA